MVGGMPVVTAPAKIDVTTGQLRGMLAGWAARRHTTAAEDPNGLDGVSLHFLRSAAGARPSD